MSWRPADASLGVRVRQGSVKYLYTAPQSEITSVAWQQIATGPATFDSHDRTARPEERLCGQKPANNVGAALCWCAVPMTVIYQLEEWPKCSQTAHRSHLSSHVAVGPWAHESNEWGCRRGGGCLQRCHQPCPISSCNSRGQSRDPFGPEWSDQSGPTRAPGRTSPENVKYGYRGLVY